MRYKKAILILGAITNPVWNWRHRDIFMECWRDNL